MTDGLIDTLTKRQNNKWIDRQLDTYGNYQTDMLIDTKAEKQIEKIENGQLGKYTAG